MNDDDGGGSLRDSRVFVAGKKRVLLNAIKSLGLNVTPAMVSEKTGIAFSESTWILNSVAAETGAVLKVSSTGEITYCFPRDFVSAYALKGAELRVKQFANVSANLLMYLLRVSFGIILVLSLMVAIILIILALCSCDSAGDFSGFGSGGGSGGGEAPATDAKKRRKLRLVENTSTRPPASSKSAFFDLSSIGDAFSWNYTSSHQAKMQKYREGNFFLECFSFLFGDGDPNADLEERKWKAIAAVIRQNNGVVLAEQLAPYTGCDPADDSGIIRVMQHFQGEPAVTDDGVILYVFESLREPSTKPPKFTSAVECIQERMWKYSMYPAKSMTFVCSLAVVNFGLSWWLFKHISTLIVLTPFAVLIDCMLIYGSLFLLIPLFRTYANVLKNMEISKRNKLRLKFADALRHPTSELCAKLRQAASFGARNSEPQNLGGATVYSSDRDLLEQQYDTVSSLTAS